MDTLKVISPSKWAARKAHFTELIEKMGAVGLTGGKNSEQRSLQKPLASHQRKQDAKASKSMLAAWRCRRSHRKESPNKGIALERHYRVVPGWVRRCI